MLTARAEHRLSLRADNADLRLTPRGLAEGLVGPERGRAFACRAAALSEARARLEAAAADACLRKRLRAEGVSFAPEAGHAGDAPSSPGLSLLAAAAGRAGGAESGEGGMWRCLAAAAPSLAAIAVREQKALEAEALYAPYLARAEVERARLARARALALPPGLDYRAVPGLGAEAADQLDAARPRTLAEAQGLVSPAAALLLLRHLHARTNPSARASAA